MVCLVSPKFGTETSLLVLLSVDIGGLIDEKRMESHIEHFLDLHSRWTVQVQSVNICRDDLANGPRVLEARKWHLPQKALIYIIFVESIQYHHLQNSNGCQNVKYIYEAPNQRKEAINAEPIPNEKLLIRVLIWPKNYPLLPLILSVTIGLRALLSVSSHIGLGWYKGLASPIFSINKFLVVLTLLCASIGTLLEDIAEFEWGKKRQNGKDVKIAERFLPLDHVDHLLNVILWQVVLSFILVTTQYVWTYFFHLSVRWFI